MKCSAHHSAVILRARQKDLAGLRGAAGKFGRGLRGSPEISGAAPTRRCSGPASWRVPRQAVPSAELDRSAAGRSATPRHIGVGFNCDF